MKIPLTNDDGIYAAGLWASARSLAAVGEVAVAAPDREQSGVVASMTRHAPLFAHEAPAAQYLRQFAPDDATPPRAAAAVTYAGDMVDVAHEETAKAMLAMCRSLGLA